MIELKNICLEFDRPILKDVNLNLIEGETLGILGRSGAGKSSLLSVIAGKLTPQSGGMYFKGKSLPQANQLLIPGYDFVQIVEQNFSLDLYHTVYENVHVKATHLAFDKRDFWVRRILSLLGLKKIENQKAITLSGGEQQRLALARAIASKPILLLLDEPFAHLDEFLKSKLIVYLSKIKAQINLTIVLVSHDGSDLLSLSDKIIHLKNGRISKKRDPKEMFYNPKNQEEARLFGNWNKISCKDQKIEFRPNQYEIVKSGGIEIHTVTSIFRGSFYENYCESEFGNFMLNSIRPILKGIQIVVQK